MLVNDVVLWLPCIAWVWGFFGDADGQTLATGSKKSSKKSPEFGVIPRIIHQKSMKMSPSDPSYSRWSLETSIISAEKCPFYYTSRRWCPAVIKSVYHSNILIYYLLFPKKPSHKSEWTWSWTHFASPFTGSRSRARRVPTGFPQEAPCRRSCAAMGPCPSRWSHAMPDSSWRWLWGWRFSGLLWNLWMLAYIHYL